MNHNLIPFFIKLILLTLISCCLSVIISNAQAPEKISYQAVVFDANNVLVKNTTIGMQVSILQGSPTGTSVYSETHSPATNSSGLVTVEIGTGATLDIFSEIDWSSGPYYSKIEIDITGGTTYSITGISQLLSVPYAFFAKTADYDSLINKPEIKTDSSILIGTGAGENSNASKLIAVGDSTLYNNTKENQIAIGNQSLRFNTTGEKNTALGHKALYSNTEGSSNTSIGYITLFSNITGNQNIAIGGYALYSNTSGNKNIAIGDSTLFDNNNGDFNTATGIASLRSNTTGFYNTSNGAYALKSNLTGYYNTATGFSALYSNTEGEFKLNQSFTQSNATGQTVMVNL